MAVARRPKRFSSQSRNISRVTDNFALAINRIVKNETDNGALFVVGHELPDVLLVLKHGPASVDPNLAVIYPFGADPAGGNRVQLFAINVSSVFFTGW